MTARRIALLCLLMTAALAGGLLLRAEESTSAPAETSTAQQNIDYWLDRGEPASAPAREPTSQPGSAPNPLRPSHAAWAVPGSAELSDGTILRGMLSTTPGACWRVWVEADKRWRLIPPLAVLAIEARVLEERMELQWRWKAMGEPEKVYTGRSYPFRRFEWTFTLIDSTEITGSVKGQPLWVQTNAGRQGPYLLAERSKGPLDSSLETMVYLRKAIFQARR